MKDNPVWRENYDVFLREGHGYAVYFYILAVLAPVEFLSLYLPSLDAQRWSGAASLFRVCSATALLVVSYFALRVANQEFAPWRFRPLKNWIRDSGLSAASVARGQLAFLVFHAGLSVLICAPLLVWAGAIARTPVGKIALTHGLLLFYALIYGVWGLLGLSLWERRPETRQVFIRCFFFTVVLLSALLYLPANPIAFLLAFLSEQPLPPLKVGAVEMPGNQFHLLFHLLLGSAGTTAYLLSMRKERSL